jgi:hypothetical protein
MRFREGGGRQAASKDQIETIEETLALAADREDTGAAGTAEVKDPAAAVPEVVAERAPGGTLWVDRPVTPSPPSSLGLQRETLRGGEYQTTLNVFFARQRFRSSLRFMPLVLCAATSRGRAPFHLPPAQLEDGQ